jgi:hypothetical protein
MRKGYLVMLVYVGVGLGKTEIEIRSRGNSFINNRSEKLVVVISFCVPRLVPIHLLLHHRRRSH